MFLAKENKSAIVCSAVVIALAEGVFITTIPFFDASCTSTLSTPIPARPINLKFSPKLSIISLSILVALRTTTAS